MTKEELDTLVYELEKVSQQRFTGKVTIDVNFREGGVGNITMNINKTLMKTPKHKNYMKKIPT